MIVTSQEQRDFVGLEQLTFDLFAIVPSDHTLHLDSNGLPTVGTLIAEGMIVIGKIGRTESYDPHNLPSCLQMNKLSFEQLRQMCGHMFYDGSTYASREMVGRVTKAFVTGDNCDGRIAYVEIE